ncbi:Innexin [Caligus rogercresseyi]|uniref:Innexin n=1 Tax=Caligus rogercresseyi TaxID=217165 RepID=A0A7T8KKT1_CALRO|nr:Innexin [Caligus rogercresseyi]
MMPTVPVILAHILVGQVVPPGSPCRHAVDPAKRVESVFIHVSRGCTMHWGPHILSS